MTLVAYYLFKKLPNQKGGTRMDCIASTGNYTEFEEKRATKPYKGNAKADPYNVNNLKINITQVPPNYPDEVRKTADRIVNMQNKPLSTIYKPDPTGNFGYGDVQGTTDALLFVTKFETVGSRVQDGGTLEVFIARGMSKDKISLYNVFADGCLLDEMDELRERAKPEAAVQNLEN